MKKLWTAVGALCTASVMISAAAPAAAAYYTDRYGHRHYYNSHRGYRHNYAYRHYTYRDDCWAEHHRSANTGTVLGAIGGGLIGNLLAGSGSRGLGTVLGAGGGAVIGHQIGASSHRCR